MSPVMVILVFVGIPLAIIAFCYLLGVSGVRNNPRPQRYKLGETWDREPLWFVGRPRETTTVHVALPALTAAPVDQSAPTVVGGAGGTWK